MRLLPILRVFPVKSLPEQIFSIISLIRKKQEKYIKKFLQKALWRIREAAARGAQIVCLQELFRSQYFCREESAELFALAESIPGPTTETVGRLARELGVVVIASLFERRTAGLYHNTAAVIGTDGEITGIYRKMHIPDDPLYFEKFYFTPGDLGYPVFETKYAKVGVYICYDRHFPEGARALGLNGAEIVFNPSATVAGLSEYLWELEQPAHAVANGYFVGAINRVGEEKPWSIGEFYGKSYFCNPRGKIFAQASRDKDEVLVADLDLDMILEVRKVWQFFRDRRPESYGILTAQSGKSGVSS